jgi:hypothetical protein
MKNFFSQKTGFKLWQIWLVFFIFTVLVATIVQLVIIPAFASAWSTEAGLLTAGDSVSFHAKAVILARAIREQGWSAWYLWPDGQGPAGIAGAIYAVTTSQPWVLIPLNAALHATSGILVVLILELFTSNRKIAFFSAMPFIGFPSAMIWYAQIHKDSYTIPGSLLFMLGWALLAQLETWKSGKFIFAAAFVFIGSALIWLMRPYQVEIFQLLAVLSSVGLFALYTQWLINKRWGVVSFLFACVTVGALIFSLTPFVKNTPLTNSSLSNFKPIPAPPRVSDWQNSGWLPATLENKILAFSEARENYIAVSGQSDLDEDVHFHNIGEVVRYLPRALQLGLFSPFPSLWFGNGSAPENTLMRRVSIFETLLVYLGLAGCLGLFRQVYSRPDFWLIVYFCLTMILSYSMVVVNIGTLYRFRYAFLMLLVSMGYSYWLNRWYKDKSSLTKSAPSA